MQLQLMDLTAKSSIDESISSLTFIWSLVVFYKENMNVYLLNVIDIDGSEEKPRMMRCMIS